MNDLNKVQSELIARETQKLLKSIAEDLDSEESEEEIKKVRAKLQELGEEDGS